MMKKILPFLFIAVAVVLFCTSSYAAGSSLGTQRTLLSEEDPEKPKKEAVNTAPNVIKLNLTALPLNNYGIQYEHVLNARMSVGLQARRMPSSLIPFRSTLKKHLGDEDGEDMDKILDQVKIENFSLTPEWRLYFGKKYGQGMYISLFYRFAQFKSNDLPIDFEVDEGREETVHLSGKINAHTAGFLLGWQKNIGPLVLDLWIIGPHGGKATGTFLSKSDHLSLSPSEQQELESSIEDIDIPLIKKEVEVTENQAKMKLKGPWAGIRSGISLGVRF